MPGGPPSSEPDLTGAYGLGHSSWAHLWSLGRSCTCLETTCQLWASQRRRPASCSVGALALVPSSELLRTFSLFGESGKPVVAVDDASLHNPSLAVTKHV